MRHGKIMDVPFCLPLIFNHKATKERAISYCNKNNIETRPIISGNLLRQTCLRDSFNSWAYKNSEFIHENGFYVGLHSKVTKDQLVKLLDYVTFIATH
jgi:CDP-6-deoxy-D-xylo-4-hexulose-3-dehydrase